LERIHCGHDNLVAQADKSRERLLEFIRKNIEELVQKAGLQ
jgi:hypothetical protein